MRSTSVGWKEMKLNEAADMLPRLTLRQGKLVTFTLGQKNSSNSSLPQIASLLDARSTAIAAEEVMKILVPPAWCWLAHVENAAILYNGAIVVGSTCSGNSWRPRVTVFDLAGGCCRGGAEPLPVRDVFRAGISLAPPRRYIKSLSSLPNMAAASVEHAWIFSCMMSHGSTYFHGLAEAAPRLLWGVRLLYSNPKMRVLTPASSVHALLDVLGLPGRGISMTHAALFARKVTVPPSNSGMTMIGGKTTGTKSMYGTFVRALSVEVQRRSFDAAHKVSAAPSAASSVLLVRRSAMVKQRARAMLNHDEVASVLRYIVDRTGTNQSTPLVEWPEASTLQQAVAIWSRVRLAIAPHGAGGTNMIFMPPGSTFVEIIASEQRGRVYGSLAAMMRLRYVACVYNRSEAHFKPQLAERMGMSDNFVVDVRWLLNCLQKGLNSTRNTTDSPLSNVAWRRIDSLMLS